LWRFLSIGTRSFCTIRQISKGRATTRILPLCSSLFSIDKAAKRSDWFFTRHCFHHFWVRLYCHTSGRSLTSFSVSYHNRELGLSGSRYLPPNQHGWFQGGHVLGASSFISNWAGTLSNYRRLATLISAFFLCFRIFLYVKDKRNAAMHEARLCPRQNILWILDSPDYYFQPSFFCFTSLHLNAAPRGFLGRLSPSFDNFRTGPSLDPVSTHSFSSLFSRLDPRTHEHIMT
jgi:hypothetical protein